MAPLRAAQPKVSERAMAPLRAAQPASRRTRPSLRVWLLAGAAAILFASPRDVAGQTVRVTTKSGVYNQPQALRGEDVYVAYCKQCHTPQSHTGPVFIATWHGRKLSELFSFIKERMPKNEPASLSDEEYVDVMAYLLKLNQMPAGRTEVAPDAAKLSAIRIDLAKGVKVRKSATATTTKKSSTGSKP
jgi:mono/diheme cytochrome c family protein